MDGFIYKEHTNGRFKFTLKINKKVYSCLISQNDIKSRYFRCEQLGDLMSGVYSYPEKVKNYNFHVECDPMKSRTTVTLDIEAVDGPHLNENILWVLRAEHKYKKICSDIECINYKITRLNNLSKFIMDNHSGQKISREKLIFFAGRVEKIGTRLARELRSKVSIQQKINQDSVTTPPIDYFLE
jgi:hypothetical protein